MPKIENVAPTNFSRRSQLYRRHVAAGAAFTKASASAVVAAYSGEHNEVHCAAMLGLADLSSLPRIGFKGSDTTHWLEKRIPRLPSRPNLSKSQDDGGTVARLSATEYLVLGNLTDAPSLPAALQDVSIDSSTQRVYPLPRSDSHAWFALTGTYAPSVLAKLCGVDMRARKFANGNIAQSSLAHINAIILRRDLGTTTCFYILSDTSFAEYLWDAMLDAMAEFDGIPVGILALRALENGISE